VFAALNSVLSLAYYAPLVNAMYRLKPSPRVEKGSRMPVLIGVPLVLLTVALIVFGVWPSLAAGLTAPASQALLAAFGG